MEKHPRKRERDRRRQRRDGENLLRKGNVQSSELEFLKRRNDLDVTLAREMAEIEVSDI